MKTAKTKIKKPSRIFLLFILLVCFYFLFVNFKSSLFFKKTDRLNIVFYDQDILFYSIGFNDSVDYFLSFPADLKVLVPGGFGYYRLGGLGKLVSLEKKPKIYQKTFSALTNTFVDYYFYTPKEEVYFNKERVSDYLKPSLTKILFYKSNANIFDRLYLFFLFFQKKPSDFKKIDFLPTVKKNNDVFINQKKFTDQLVGLFYKNKIRKERANVQLIYSESYKNALLITKIIEGEGIWVTDISSDIDKKNSPCQIIESKDSEWLTAKYLSSFFQCSLKKENTGVFDIIFILGKLEKEWLVD